MNLIVAVDKNWAIGLNNKLLVRIPSDQKFFREETTGKVVVLGRKTLETFPGGLPLKNRTNIILSTDPDYKVKDAIVVHSIEELLEEAPPTLAAIFSSVFAPAIPSADRLLARWNFITAASVSVPKLPVMEPV